MRGLFGSSTASRKRTVFYCLDSRTGPNLPFPIECDVEIFTPTIRRLRRKNDPAAAPWLMYLFWYLASADRYRIVYVHRGEAIVHVSHVLARNPRLAFMEGADLHVGPCHTVPQLRGLGLFPATLGWIAERYPDRRIWVLADADNVASRRGIVKAGFRYAGCGDKRSGRYRIRSDQAA